MCTRGLLNHPVQQEYNEHNKKLVERMFLKTQILSSSDFIKLGKQPKIHGFGNFPQSSRWKPLNHSGVSAAVGFSYIMQRGFTDCFWEPQNIIHKFNGSHGSLNSSCLIMKYSCYFMVATGLRERSQG